MNFEIDLINLRNVLTLRYDPSKVSTNSITPANFFPEESDENGIITENLLIQSIKTYFSSNTDPIVISLSGGIDSTLTLGLIRKAFPETKIVALCGVFEDGFDESNFASEIANKFNADFHLVNMPSIFTTMPEIISITKKPKWNTYIHTIAKNAKQFSSNFVTGDGSDELFGGYTFRYENFLNLTRNHDDWIIKTKNYLECHNRDWVPDQSAMFGDSIPFDWSEIYFYFKPYFQNNLELLKQVMLADFNGKLIHDFIPLGHSIASHYNLKSFSPFLADEVVSFGLKIPIKEKYNHETNKGKIILRKISQRLGINHIDDKRGFSPNILFDWKENGESICNSYILNKNNNVFTKKLINYDWILKAFNKVKNENDLRYLNRIISVLALEIWYRIFILKDLKPTQKLE